MRRRRLLEACWPAALAEELGRESGLPRGSLAVPGWARGVERDLGEALAAGAGEDAARRAVAAAWRLRLGLPEAPGAFYGSAPA